MRESPASPAAASAFAVHLAAPGPAQQNAQLSLSLGETAEIARLRAAWQQVALAHPVLRTSFQPSGKNGLVRQEFDAAEAPWRVLDWKSVVPGDLPARWAGLLEEDASVPFDFAKPPLWRFTAIELPGGHCHLLATFPKLLLDEDSLFRILCDWLETLDGRPPSPLPETEEFPATDADAAREWWKSYLGDHAAPLALDHRSGATASGEDKLSIEREEALRLRKFCDARHVPLRDVILAAWTLVLGRLAGEDSPIVLASSATSQNWLPVKISLDHEAKAGGFLQTLARSEAEREQHASLSVPQVLSLFTPPCRLAQWPAVFVFRPPDLSERIHDALPRWINLDARLHEHSQFPLFFEAREGDRIVLRVEYTNRAPAEVRQLLERTARVLEAFVDAPESPLRAVDLLSARERETISQRSHGAKAGVPKLRIEEDIADNAVLTPEAAAVESSGHEPLTYADLLSHSGALAAHLRNAGLGEGWNIGICMTPGQWVPIALLGVLQAGDTCVPLSPSASSEWLLRQIEQSDIEMVLCDSQTAPLFETSGKRHLVLDRQWEEIAPAKSSGTVPPPKISVLLAGTPDLPRPAIFALGPELLAHACVQGIPLLSLEAGSKVPLTAPAGTGAHLDQILTVLAAGATIVIPDGDLAQAGLTHLHPTAEFGIPETVSTLVLEAGPSQSDWPFAGRFLHYHSPSGMCGHSVAFVANGLADFSPEIPAGLPAPGVELKLADNAGQPLPAGYTGRLQFVLPHHAEPVSTTMAWRNDAGLFFAVFAEPKPAETPAAIPEPEPIAEETPEEPKEEPPPPPAKPWEPFTLLQKTPDSPILYLIHDLDGDPERYRALANQFVDEWTLCATSARGFHNPAASHESVPQEAAALIEALVAENPGGPYNLLGYGYGAVLAFEMARQLLRQKRPVDFLALVGARAPQLEAGGGFFRSISRNLTETFLGRSAPDTAAAQPAAAAHLRALRAYRAEPLDMPACVILGSDLGRDAENAWLMCAPEAFIERLDYDSKDLLLEPAVKRLALLLRECTEDPAETEE